MSRQPMISLEQALQQVREQVAPLKPVKVPLDEASGMVLAEPVVSDIDIPPFNRSAMDGYAVRATDIAPAPVTLKVLETVMAGSTAEGRLEAGHAVKIMTGAPAPEGADAVVMVERTHLAGEGLVVIEEAVRAGTNIAPQGEDIAAGQTVLAAGAVLRPEEIGIMAMVGAAHPRVVRRPRVATIVTGDELIGVEKKPTGAQIRESNSLVLTAQLRRDGIVAHHLGQVSDDPDQLKQVIETGLSCSDLLILSGGVSMGDRDFVPPVLAEMGAETVFHKVAIKPGKPVLFARHGECRIFGLPGNPVSALVVYELLIRPTLRIMMGRSELAEPSRTAVLQGKVPKVIGRRQFLPARWNPAEREPTVEITRWHGSGDMMALSEANCFVVVPEKPATVREGDRLEVIPRDF